MMELSEFLLRGTVTNPDMDEDHELTRRALLRTGVAGDSLDEVFDARNLYVAQNLDGAVYLCVVGGIEAVAV